MQPTMIIKGAAASCLVPRLGRAARRRRGRLL